MRAPPWAPSVANSSTRVGSVDPPSREDHARHHRLARRLFHHQSYARHRAGKYHLNLVPSLHFRHALADQNGGELRVSDDLLGIGVVDVLAVDPHPHPDQSLGLAADLGGGDEEERPVLIDPDDGLIERDVFLGVDRVHRDDFGLGVRRKLLVRTRGLNVGGRGRTADRGQEHGRHTDRTEDSFHFRLQPLDYAKEFRRATDWPADLWSDSRWQPVPLAWLA